MIEEVRKLRNHQPFSPYTIVLTDGRRVRITDQYHVAFGRTIIVLYNEPQDAILHVYDSDIQSVSTEEVTTQASRQA